jgi:hypothetical protein
MTVVIDSSRFNIVQYNELSVVSIARYSFGYVLFSEQQVCLQHNNSIGSRRYSIQVSKTFWPNRPG